MKPCLYSCGCLSPEFCKEGNQECHIDAYVNQKPSREWWESRTDFDMDAGGIRYRQAEPYTPKRRE